MSDVVITAGSVKASSVSTRRQGIAGEAIAAGQCLYRGTDGLLYKAFADTALHAACVGIALCGAYVNQPVEYSTSDPSFIIGGTVAVGIIYIVSPNNPGGICQLNDAGLTTGNFITIVGIGISATAINMLCANSQRSGAPIVDDDGALPLNLSTGVYLDNASITLADLTYIP